MAETQVVDLIVDKDPRYFSLYANAFMVSGPIQDGHIQLEICEDFVETKNMRVFGEHIPESNPPTFGNARLEFTSEPTRLAYGRVKMNVLAAETLIRLLQEHVASAKGLRPNAEPQV